jgi:hypothetical protein
MAQGIVCGSLHVIGRVYVVYVVRKRSNCIWASRVKAGMPFPYTYNGFTVVENRSMPISGYDVSNFGKQTPHSS